MSTEITRTISTEVLRVELSEILNAAQAGEITEITRHGRPAAVVLPPALYAEVIGPVEDPAPAPSPATTPTTAQLLTRLLDTPGAWERVPFEARQKIVSAVMGAPTATTHPERH